MQYLEALGLVDDLDANAGNDEGPTTRVERVVT